MPDNLVLPNGAKIMATETAASKGAKARWKLLAAALHRQSDSNNEYSIRRFTGFNLFAVDVLNNGWYKYDWNKAENTISVFIRLLSDKTSAKDLIGFNNTGNICIWQSEETLAHYALKNQHLFRDKRVCELGGGMTSLAGILIARNVHNCQVMITDGNKASSDNLELLVEKNKENANINITTRQLVWSDCFDITSNGIVGQFDVIICADCLFFVELHQALVTTVKAMMKQDGICIMFAPKRGDTLEQFVTMAQQTMLVYVTEQYDDAVWEVHKKALHENKLYTPNIHYPLMITLKMM